MNEGPMINIGTPTLPGVYPAKKRGEKGGYTHFILVTGAVPFLRSQVIVLDKRDEGIASCPDGAYVFEQRSYAPSSNIWEIGPRIEGFEVRGG